MVERSLGVWKVVGSILGREIPNTLNFGNSSLLAYARHEHVSAWKYYTRQNFLRNSSVFYSMKKEFRRYFQ